MLIKQHLLLFPSEIQDMSLPRRISFPLIFCNYLFLLSASPPLSVFSWLRFFKSRGFNVRPNKSHELKIKYCEFLQFQIRHSESHTFMIRYAKTHMFKIRYSETHSSG
jgi:hypothetical protein